jgi:hypothetical protein
MPHKFVLGTSRREHMIKRFAVPLLERLFLSPRQTEEVLGLGHTTVAKLIADGTLESRKEGARRLVLMASVREYADVARGQSPKIDNVDTTQGSLAPAQVSPVTGAPPTARSVLQSKSPSGGQKGAP